MIQGPSVSVIISTYNRTELLAKAISSVLAQSVRDLEILVIDDASTIDVGSFLRAAFAEEFTSGRIRYFRNEKNSERSFSRNRGMEESRGKYLAFLDDDDVWEPGHLAGMVSFLESNPGVGMVLSNFKDRQRADASLKVMNQGIPSGKGMRYRMLCLRRKLISGSVYAIRKEVFREIGGFSQGIEPAEDREYLARIAMSYDVGYLEEPTVVKFTHPGSFAHTFKQRHHALVKEKTWQMIQEQAVKSSFTLPGHIRADWCLHLAVHFLPDLDKARQYLADAVRSYPPCLLYADTWQVFLRVMLGKKLYAFLRRRMRKGPV